MQTSGEKVREIKQVGVPLMEGVRSEVCVGQGDHHGVGCVIFTGLVGKVHTVGDVEGEIHGTI